MTVLKCITGVTDPFMKEHGFKRKGFVYYKMKGDIIHGVSVIRKNFAISINICCIPKFQYYLADFLFKPVDAWIQDTSIFLIEHVIDFDTFVEGATDQFVINMTERLFKCYTENVFSIIDKVDTLDALNDLYLRVKSKIESGLYYVKIDSDIKFKLHSKAHWIYQICEDYIAGKKWEEVKDNYIESFNSLLRSFKERYEEITLDSADLPKDIRDAFVPEIMEELGFLYLAKLLYDITETESLEPLKEYIDWRYNENKILFKKYLNFDI